MTTLPYAGTSGWSGSDASRERALKADTSGQTKNRRKQAMAALRKAGVHGMTYQELGAMFDWHHGTSTGVLSVLHKSGEIARLSKQKRNGCSVYMLPEHLYGRATAPHGRTNPVSRTLTAWLEVDAAGDSRASQDPQGFVDAMRAVTGR